MLESYERYVELRDKYHWRDADVARESGIPKSTISEWKRGLYTPKIDKLNKIGEALGTSGEYLLTGQDSVFNEKNAKLAAEIRSDRNLRDLVDFYKEDGEFFENILTLLRLGTPSDKSYVKTTLDMVTANKKKKCKHDSHKCDPHSTLSPLSL